MRFNWDASCHRCVFVRLTNALFTASMNSVSGNASNSLTISVFVLHTIELKLSDSGNKAMTPSGRNRCQATKFSSAWNENDKIISNRCCRRIVLTSLSSTVAIRPIWLYLMSTVFTFICFRTIELAPSAPTCKQKTNENRYQLGAIKWTNGPLYRIDLWLSEL